MLSVGVIMMLLKDMAPQSRRVAASHGLNEESKLSGVPL